MKYIWIVLLIFISGCIPKITCEYPYVIINNECCLDENKDSICDKEKSFLDILKEAEGSVEKPKEESQQILNEHELYIGDFFDFDGIKIKLENVDINGEVTLIISGKKWIIYETNHQEIVESLEIKVNKIHYDLDKDKSYAILEVNKYNLKDNEYLIIADEGVIINYVNIKLYNVEPDNSVKLYITDIGLTRIRLGESLKIKGLNITNIKSFHRPSRAENYAILKITKV